MNGFKTNLFDQLKESKLQTDTMSPSQTGP